MKVTISRRALLFIFQEEAGGKAWYEKFGSRPSWPKGASGITVGGGYDLGYHTAKQVENDWRGLISEKMIRLLQSVAGLKGVKAANALTSEIVKGVYIPYDIAYKQYFDRVLKVEVSKTVKAFPESDKLNPEALGVLVSVVYNRGTAMADNDTKAKDRLEMRVIRDLVPKRDYKGIAEQIRSMKRLWDGIPDYEGDKEQKMSGLLKRREEEACIMEKSEREYKTEELISIII